MAFRALGPTHTPPKPFSLPEKVEIKFLRNQLTINISYSNELKYERSYYLSWGVSFGDLVTTSGKSTKF